MKVLLTIVLSVLITQGTAYPPQKTCEVAQTNTFIADPEDCAGYYYCVDGKVSFHDKCENGLLYDSYSGTCNYANQVQCHFGKSVCQNAPPRSYRADPNTCSGYIYCDDKGKALLGKCPNGQDFDLSTTSCIWSGATTCAGKPCALVSNNHFVANGQRTSPDGVQYGALTCYNGEGREFWCDVGFIYNPLKGECEYNNEVAAKPVDCSTVTATNNFVASPTNCNQYYYCKDATDKTPTKLNCPFRFHFDATNNQCVDATTYVPTGANKDCDRCGGYGKGYYVDSDSTCKSYYFCTVNENNEGITNKQQPATACKNPNFSFFNEVSQTCVSTKPTTGICASP